MAWAMTRRPARSRMLEAMRDAGYGVTDLPASGNELIESLQQGHDQCRAAR